MHLKIAISLLFAVITVNNSENKFGTLKNLTRNPQNQENGDHADLIKTEIKKYLSECGADVSEENSDSESKHSNRNSSSSRNGDSNRNYNSGGYHNNNRDQNRRNNGNWDGSNRGYSNYGGYNTGQSYGGYDSSRDDNRDGLQTSYGSWGGSGSGNYRNPHDGTMRTGYNQSNYGSYGYGRQPDSYPTRSSDSMNGRSGYDGGSYTSTSGRDGYGYRSSYLRTKRSDDDVECISQCVFGYLEVLDDNRSPSESALIKWLQDHMPSDGKRIKALRETRRCFARLASSDDDDGCDFSKSLSKCLNLEIED